MNQLIMTRWSSYAVLLLMGLDAALHDSARPQGGAESASREAEVPALVLAVVTLEEARG